MRGIRSCMSSSRAMKTWSSIASASAAADVLTGWKLSTMSSLVFVSGCLFGGDVGRDVH